jgi:hypothetical protein
MLPVAPHRADAALVDDVRADADWILKAQFADGAIANYVDRKTVWPYLSNFAAMGLARATDVTRDTRYVKAAWRWLKWYQSRMDAQGFVNDYVMSGGTLLSTGSMDSTDAYAGTFLLALLYTYRSNPDKTMLRTFRTGIAKAVGAIEATQQADGLTWAKPSWLVKYLMDQAETYAGLIAASDLAKVLGDTTLSQRAAKDATRMRNGVAATWNASRNAYDWAIFPSGRTTTQWSILYSDSLQQAWAVAFGIVDSSRSNTLVARFAAVQPKWALPLATALFSGGQLANVGYWPAAGIAFSKVRNSAAPAAVRSIRSAALTSGRAWPFTTGNAGQLIVFASFGTATTTTLRPTTETFAPVAPSPSSTASSAASGSTPAPNSPTPTSATTTPPPTPAPAPATPTPTPAPTSIIPTLPLRT